MLALRPAAFFDLDRTLVPVNTGRLFVGHMRKRGELSMGRALQALSWLARYHFALLDIQAVAARVVQVLKGQREDEFAEMCQRWVEDTVLPRLLPEGLRKIESHRKLGQFLAILSTSPIYVVGPVARSLGMDALGATSLEVEKGLFTGRLEGPACYGTGKIHWAESLQKRHHLNLDASWFYTDSYTDLPMLERVSHRVVVNPDPRLKRTARTRGWTIERWD
ncbi:MAG: HAD family hydrolase [Deltaproteobacteria bacterium]|nr:HAD family hydrolase [Deltaproteobacteria bacterium]